MTRLQQRLAVKGVAGKPDSPPLSPGPRPCLIPAPLLPSESTSPASVSWVVKWGSNEHVRLSCYRNTGQVIVIIIIFIFITVVMDSDGE